MPCAAGPDGTIISVPDPTAYVLPAAMAGTSGVAAAAADMPGLQQYDAAAAGFQHQPEQPLDVLQPGAGQDYLQTTTITEVPSMSNVAAGSSSGAARVVVKPEGQRMPMAAGATTTISPAGTTTTSLYQPSSSAQQPLPEEVRVESPVPSLAGAGLSGTPVPAAEPLEPQVDSPADDMDVNMDLLSNLQGLSSTELMMTDDVSRDDLWDMLFGQQGSALAGIGTTGSDADLGRVSSMGFPGLEDSLLDSSTAAALAAVPQAVIDQPATNAGTKQR